MANLYRRNQVYWLDFNLNGRRQRLSLKTTNRKKAEEYKQKIERDIFNKVYLDKIEDSSLENLLANFINNHLSHLAIATQKMYLNSVRRITEYFNIEQNTLSKAELYNYVQSKRAKGDSDRTIKADILILNFAFKKGMEAELTSINPIEKFNMKELKKSKPILRFLSKDEYQRLIDISSGYLKKAIILAIETGFRKEELFSLKWEDVDLESKIITLKKTKNGFPRSVPITPLVKNILIELYEDKKMEYIYVLTNEETGTRFIDLKRSWRTALKEARIENFRWHDLRHTFGTWATKGWFLWQKTPMEIYRISRWMGHTSINVTLRYAKLHTEDLKNEIVED